MKIRKYILDSNSVPFLLGLMVGLIIMPITLLGWNLAYYPGDLGDSRFNLYILEHGYKFLTGQISEYWNAPFMVPDPDVISYSDNLLATVPLYGFFRLLGFEIFTAFQLWFVSLFVLNYTCFYFFAKWLFKNRYAAIIGAFVFAFALSNQVSMTHVQVMPRFFIPLAVWMILRFSEEFEPKYFFLSLLFMTAQLYASVYLGLLTFLTGGILMLISAVASRAKLIPRIRNRRWWIFIISSALINLAFVLFLMLPYISRSDTVTKTPYIEILKSIPVPISYLYSKGGSLVWGFLGALGNDLPNPWNQQLFPGALAFLSFFILLGFLLFKRKYLSRAVILLISTGLIIILLFIRFGDHTLYTLVYALPGYDSMRSMDRIINIVFLFLGVSAGWCFVTALQQKKKGQLPVFIIIIVLLGIDNYVKPKATYRSEKSVALLRMGALMDKMREIPKNSVISYEPDSVDNDAAVQLDAMLSSQALDLKSINGYSAMCAWDFSAFWRYPNADNRIHWLKSMNADTIKVYVIK